MVPHAHPFLLLSILVLLTVLIIFGMKYVAAGRAARIRDDVERDLTIGLASVKADLADMKGRLAAIEKILKEVE